MYLRRLLLQNFFVWDPGMGKWLRLNSCPCKVCAATSMAINPKPSFGVTGYEKSHAIIKIMWLQIRTLNSILSWPIAISKTVINCVVGNWLRGYWSAFLIFHCEREDYGSNHSLQWISQILNYSVLPSLLIATEGYTPTKHSLWWLLGSCNSHNRSAPEAYIEFLVTTMMYLHDEHDCYTVEPLYNTVHYRRY